MISNYARTLGIDRLGFLKAGPFFLENKESLARYNHAKKENYLSTFVSQRDYSIFTEYKTVLLALVAYPNPLFDGPASFRQKEGYKKGYLSASSWGQDYHKVLRDKLEKLAEFLLEETQLKDYQIRVDQASFSEREMALRAGLGWIGKNSLLINDQLGSFVFIGQLFLNIDIDFPKALPFKDLCGDCNLCVKACPVQAIDGQERLVDTNLCLSEQSQRKKMNPAIENKFAKNKYLYGCDICQLVCPWNQKKRKFSEEFTGREAEIIINLEELLEESNRTFKNKYGHMAGSWRGKNIWQRNARLIMSADLNRKNITSGQNASDKDSN